MDDQQIQETIEAYLREQMSPAEAAAFEAQVAADPALAERVALQRLAFRAVDRLAERNLQEKFAQWRVEADAAEEGAKTPPAAAGGHRQWLIAALLCLLVAAGAFWFWKQWDRGQRDVLEQPQKDRQQQDTLPAKTLERKPVASEQKQPLSIPTPEEQERALFALAESEINAYGERLTEGAKRRDSRAKSPKDSLLIRADSLLKEKKYSSATALLKQISLDSTLRASALKRLAFAYHKLGQPAQAIAAYQQCERLTPSNAEEHDWLLCLYYLADWPQHQKKFGERLKKMTGDPNHGYHDKALKLKQKLQAAGMNDER